MRSGKEMAKFSADMHEIGCDFMIFVTSNFSTLAELEIVFQVQKKFYSGPIGKALDSVLLGIMIHSGTEKFLFLSRIDKTGFWPFLSECILKAILLSFDFKNALLD